MKHIARLLLVALIATLLVCPASADSLTVYAVGNIVRCYASASSSAKQLGTLGYGESAECVALNGSWAQIEAKGVTAWCRSDEISTVDPNKYSVTAYVISDGAKAYARPARSGTSVSVKAGSKLTVVAITPDGDWCRVKSSGKYAYMQTDALSKTKPEAKTSEEPSVSKSLTAYIADEIVYVYSSASRSSRIAAAAFGEKVTCVAVDGSMAKIIYGSETGWCYKSKLTTEDPNTGALTVYPRESGVKVYAKPDRGADVLCELKLSNSLKCVALTPDGSWLRVTASGKYGYVEKSAMSTVKSDDKIDRIIDLAMEQLDKPYVYATRGPKTFDCSGLTLYCFREIAGITLGRSAQLQGYNDNFTKIENINDIRRGDIVCFDTEPDDDDLTDHVGIYLGNGKFIHASSAAGKVIISTMSSGYYRRVFTWGRRLIE